MTIKKKIEQFINKGADVSADKKEESGFTSILLRIPNSIVLKVNNEVEKKPWVKRTSWILDAINEKLNKGDE